MKTFQNKNDGFKEIQKQALFRSLPILGLALGVGLIISYSGFNRGEMGTLPYVIVMVLGAGGFGVFKGLNRQRKLFESYRLTLDDEFIQREQLNTPTVRIEKDDIKEILAHNGSFTIKGKSKAEVIIVTNKIDNYADLEASLKEVKDFTIPAGKSSMEKLRLPLVLSTLALMGIVFISSSKYLVLVSGTILTLILAWSFYEVQTSKNIDSNTKRNSWWTIVVMITVIVVTYMKVTG